MPERRSRGRPRKSADAPDDGNRRQALLQAAAQLFRQQGFAATRTRDIAAAAGMQSGSPFFYYDQIVGAVQGLRGVFKHVRPVTLPVPTQSM